MEGNSGVGRKGEGEVEVEGREALEARKGVELVGWWGDGLGDWGLGTFWVTCNYLLSLLNSIQESML